MGREVGAAAKKLIVELSTTFPLATTVEHETERNVDGSLSPESVCVPRSSPSAASSRCPIVSGIGRRRQPRMLRLRDRSHACSHERSLVSRVLPALSHNTQLYANRPWHERAVAPSQRPRPMPPTAQTRLQEQA